jgi:hypothetical protein
MKRSNIILLAVALFGFVIASFLLVRAIRFFHFMHELRKNNPELNYLDTNELPVRSDTLYTVNADLNRQIAEALQHSRDTLKVRQQATLHLVITEFIQALDSLEQTNNNREQTLISLKPLVNKTNLGSRAGLFNIKDDAGVPALKSFMLLDINNLTGTDFECLARDPLTHECFEKIKQAALLLQSQILNANLLHLKSVP